MPLLAPQTIFEAFTLNGTPLAGGRVLTYAAGTSTPQASFTDSTGATANTNPVILDSRGQAPIWLSEDVAYKIRVEDPGGSLLWETDNVVGVGSGTGNGDTTQASEWLDYSGTPTYISPTSFSVTGNETATFHVGRRTRSTVTGGVSYATIASSVFGTGITTVTVTNDSLPLDAGLSAVSYGLLSADNPSASVDCIAGLGTIALVPTGGILPYGGSSAPTGFLLCDGASYLVADYQALHAVIGDTFGGDGGTNFNVPDLRGRGPIGFGQGDTAEGGGAGTPRSISEKIGAETHTLTVPEMPAHTHVLNQQDAGLANNSVVGKGDNNNPTASPAPVQSTGGDGAHANMSPSLVVTMIIKT